MIVRSGNWKAAIACMALLFAAVGCETPSVVSSALKGGGAPWSSVSILAEKREAIVTTPYLGDGGGMGSKSWGRGTHPFLFAMSSNRYYLTYTVLGDVPEGAVGVAAVDWPAWSEDAGKSWQTGIDPFIWLDSPPAHPRAAHPGDELVWHMGYRGGVTRMPGGIVVAYAATPVYLSGAGLKNHVTQAIWTRDGVSINGPVPVSFYTPLNVQFALMNARGIALPDGSVIVTLYVIIPEHKRPSGYYSLLVYKSLDGGKTYGYFSTIATPEDVPWGTEGPCEASMIVLPDGDLLCMARTGLDGTSQKGPGGLLQARSSDGGKTWALSNSEISGVNPKLVLLQNGVVALGYGRPGLHLAFSEDGGRTWKKRMKINQNNEMTTGYLDMIEAEPNRLIVVYDLMGYPYKGQEVTGIFQQFIDVKRSGGSD